MIQIHLQLMNCYNNASIQKRGVICMIMTINESLFSVITHISRSRKHNSMYKRLDQEKLLTWLTANCMYVPVVIAMCRVQCAASHVQRGDLDKTVPRNVSVTTMAFVYCLMDSVSAPPDTQENGKSYFYSGPVSITASCVQGSKSWILNLD